MPTLLIRRISNRKPFYLRLKCLLRLTMISWKILLTKARSEIGLATLRMKFKREYE